MIQKLSLRIAQFIRENHAQSASQDVLVFSLTIVLNTLFVITLLLLIGLVTGKTAAVATLLFAFIVLRFFSGGFHLPTSALCNTISIAIFVILMFIPIPYHFVGMVLNGIALVLVVIFSPTKDIMHLNKLGPKYTIHLKAISTAIVASNFLIQSPLLSLAFLTQSLTLLPIAYKAVELLERR